MKLNQFISKYASRKGVGELLQLLKQESNMKIDYIAPSKLILKDGNNKVEIKFYKTGWRVVFNFKEDYCGEQLGHIPKGKYTFTKSKNLKNFLSKNKNIKVDLNDKNESNSYDVIDSIIGEIELLLIENGKCFTKINESIFNQIIRLLKGFQTNESDFDIFLLFEFFQYVEKLNISKFEKELALYVIAKRIIEFKYTIKSRLSLSDLESEIQATSNPICYAHVLQFYGGKCKYLHGHNGKLVIRANMKSDTLSKRPMFISYGFLKGFLKYIDKLLDHKTYWALNQNDKVDTTKDGLKISTPMQTIIFHQENGLVLFPYLFNGSPFSTSEVTLNNFVVPQFYIYLIRFLIDDNGPDSTSMAMYDLSEVVKFSFQWYETDSTVCTVRIDC